eukprot:2185988-Pleurochrysis_carterae.AAC.3
MPTNPRHSARDAGTECVTVRVSASVPISVPASTLQPTFICVCACAARDTHVHRHSYAATARLHMRMEACSGRSHIHAGKKLTHSPVPTACLKPVPTA